MERLIDAVSAAISKPNKEFEVARLVIYRNGSWLRIRLPSGRTLTYPSPRLDENGTISYMGINAYSRKFDRIETYGGKLFENICQAGSRDIMAHAMLLAEERGYKTVLTVHDELITEAPDTDRYTVGGLSDILATNPPWADGLPLAADGFEAKRYRKD